MIKKIQFFFILCLPSIVFANTGISSKFDHQFHVTNVFAKNNFQCSQCHNLENTNNGKLKATDLLESKTFKLSTKEMCHQCHQGSAYPSAPKECFTCHDTSERLQNIKPLDHQNINWKSGAHAGLARADSGSCMNCHTNNQCIKCHTSRNSVINQNHSKNYRYFHSIEARMNPAKCATCHTETYCIRCHLGGVK
jgi:hypothetical protein